jgi:hypothetical protein
LPQSQKRVLHRLVNHLRRRTPPRQANDEPSGVTVIQTTQRLLLTLRHSAQQRHVIGAITPHPRSFPRATTTSLSQRQAWLVPPIEACWSVGHTEDGSARRITTLARCGRSRPGPLLQRDPHQDVDRLWRRRHGRGALAVYGATAIIIYRVTSENMRPRARGYRPRRDRRSGDRASWVLGARPRSVPISMQR